VRSTITEGIIQRSDGDDAGNDGNQRGVKRKRRDMVQGVRAQHLPHPVSMKSTAFAFDL